MTKRVFLLMGISILAVIATHAAGFGQAALLDWTDRYRAVTGPGFDPMNSPQYYVLLGIRQLLVWAVPAFLFVSGFFIAYAARGTKGNFTWKMARKRAIDLLIPYVLWSLVWFLLDAIRGIVYTPVEYLVKLATGTADNYGSYYFMLILIQLYLLAPLIVPLAKKRARLLLLLSALVEVTTLAIRYWALFASRSPVLATIDQVVSQYWLLFLWTFFLPLGLVCGLQGARFRRWLERYKFAILAATIVLGVLALVEPEVIYRLTNAEWRFLPITLPTACYAIGFILCFLAFDRVAIPFPKAIQQIGQKSFAIYLVHLRAMHLVARIIYGVLPSLLAYQVSVLFPILFVSGLGIPLLLLASLTRSPARRYYRYVFG